MAPELIKLLELITGGGPWALAAVFALLYWSERNDNKAIDERNRDLLERTLTALNNTATALGDLRVYLGMNRADGGRH